LDEVLKGEKLVHIEKTFSQPFIPAASDVLPQFDAYMVELELHMERLFATLSDMVKGAGIVAFSKVIKGQKRLETIRTFLLLLFLAQEGKVKLWQDEQTEEIYVTVGELNIAEGEKPSV
jgi:chromatin segregation and condensation protein Rec8/ScpA/Scc1 (kleisin family)